MKSFRSLSSRLRFLAVTILTAAIIVGVGIGIQLLFDRFNSPQVPVSVPTTQPTITASDSPSTPVVSPTPTAIPSITVPPPPKLQPPRSLSTQTPLATDDVFEFLPSAENVQPKMTKPKNSYFGHLPYREDSQQRLVQIGTYYQREEFLDKEAAIAFNQMKSDARSNGIEIVPISGFRSIAYQEKLFQKQIQRQGSKQAAAKLSAPPGYSEHHTGYAIDLGDGQQPDTDLKFQFEYTEAYRWLTVRAQEYGFQLSFPRNNIQGVSFEPWHWRYFNSPRARQIFGFK